MLLSTFLKTKNIVFKNAFLMRQSVQTLRRQKEKLIAQKIKKSLNASYVSVTDTTVGNVSCGQMYNILVQSPEFEGKSKVKQHQLVTEVLKVQLKQIHGFNLKTKVPIKQKPVEKNDQ